MHVDKDFIRRVATNARLELSEKEIEKFVSQFKEILDAFSKLDELNTKDVEIQIQPVELKNALREDTICPSLSQEDALSNTQHKKDGYFKGPRAL
ncbi:Asp-tRNA(Asn)/Glu-tRNA(Gln) amidotransferase subunit GatC [Candidatus Woesearchaeota archaeon]|nr:Asp-tRNA(Asn)/Glu-tRNA(Gln) amidotransferase subunit GatC [Candidatus Woesearchaeota archaeon]